MSHDYGSPSLMNRSLLSFVAVAVMGPSSTAAQELEWQALPDMPIGKWEAAAAVIDDKIYLFGGYIQNVRSSKRSDIFDPSDGSWTRLQDLPSAVSHINAVLDGRTVWFAGGFKDGYRGNLHFFGGLKADRDTDAPDHWVLDVEARMGVADAP